MPRTANSKACDLCYRRRIKCDAKKPRCSQCIIHEVECTYEARSRRKKRATSNKETDAPTSAVEALDEGRRQIVGPDSTIENRPLGLLPEGPCGSRLSFPGGPALSPRSPSAKPLELPCKRVVSALVDTFISMLNNVMPLYDPVILSRTVDTWYERPQQRDITAWASINVVMALAQHYSPTDYLENSGYNVELCLANAQSVLTEVMTGDLQLDSVQIVLGLVMLFQGAPDLRPALILMSTALRLAQTLGIHRKDYYQGIAPRDALQRTRVFWIAYILDRDISLRCRQAPLQQDAEVDVELPADGQMEQPAFSVFHCQIELAQIQSLVYQCLFSVQASRMTDLEATNAKKSIVLLLKGWKERIPPNYRAEVLIQDSFTILPRIFCTLYCRMVTCLGQLSQVNSMDLRWIHSLLAHAQAVTRGSLSTPPSPPQHWDMLIAECRSFMNLFLSIRHKDSSFIWTHLCPFSSGLLCLSANSLLTLGTTAVEPDDGVQAASAEFLNDLTKHTNHEVLKKSLEAFHELNWHRTLMTASWGSLTTGEVNF